MYPPPCTGLYILTQALSHRVGDWNGLDGWYWKSIVHVRLVPHIMRISSMLNER